MEKDVYTYHRDSLVLKLTTIDTIEENVHTYHRDSYVLKLITIDK